jgi:hypothetical protein
MAMSGKKVYFRNCVVQTTATVPHETNDSDKCN